MSKGILGTLAVLAVAGWALAIFVFITSEDLESQLEMSDVERRKLAEDLVSAQKEMKKQVETTGRLDEIGQKLLAAEDEVTALEVKIQSRRDELAGLAEEVESRKAELTSLETKLNEYKAQINELEEDIEQARIEKERLRSEADEMRKRAEPTQVEPLAESRLEPQTMTEGEPSAAEPEESDSVAKARKRFEIVDQNGDGKIEEFEFRVSSVKLLGLIDANKDGFVTVEETKVSPEQFKLFDPDEDGKLSSVEFVRAFPILDSNRRGFITFEDYLAFSHGAAK